MPRDLPSVHLMTVSLVLLPLALLFAVASPVRAQTPRPVVVLDRIVAVVNDEVVTRNDLDERVKLAFAQLKRQGTPPPPRDVLEKQLLDRIITCLLYTSDAADE